MAASVLFNHVKRYKVHFSWEKPLLLSLEITVYPDRMEDLLLSDTKKRDAREK